MFPSGPFDFFYAPHNQVASTVMNMTFSIPVTSGGFFSGLLGPELSYRGLSG
jgi:hypothetical protein